MITWLTGEQDGRLSHGKSLASIFDAETEFFRIFPQFPEFPGVAECWGHPAQKNALIKSLCRLTSAPDFHGERSSNGCRRTFSLDETSVLDCVV